MKAQFNNITFKTQEKFDEWLDKETDIIIHLKDQSQDMTMIWLHESGEILHTDMLASIYNGRFVDVGNLTVNKPIRIWDDKEFTERDLFVVEEISYKNPITSIRRTRLKMRWTQGWLADQLGVAQQTLRNYEKGNTEPPKMIYLAIEQLVEQERRKWV